MGDCSLIAQQLADLYSSSNELCQHCFERKHSRKFIILQIGSVFLKIADLVSAQIVLFPVLILEIFFWSIAQPGIWSAILLPAYVPYWNTLKNMYMIYPILQEIKRILKDTSIYKYKSGKIRIFLIFKQSGLK